MCKPLENGVRTRVQVTVRSAELPESNLSKPRPSTICIRVWGINTKMNFSRVSACLFVDGRRSPWLRAVPERD